MTANQSPGRIPTDADLIRYLDGEASADERERIDAAQADDAAVSERLDTLRSRGERLGELLAQTDPDAQVIDAANPARRTSSEAREQAVDPPERDDFVAQVRSIYVARLKARGRPRDRSGWLRAAAVIIALLGASLLVPPVRAWIVDRLEAITGDEGTAAEPSPGMPPDAGAPIAYDITVTGSVLEVAIDEVQVDGELVIGRSAAAGAHLEPLGGGAGDPVLLSSDRVRIQNAAGSTSSYRLTVPPAVTTVRLRVSDREAHTVTVDEEEIRIPLSDTGV